MGSAATPYLMLIDGEWVPAQSGKTLQSFNPFNGEPVAEVPSGDNQDVDRAVQAARRAFDEGPWPCRSGEERAAVLLAVSKAIQDQMPALIDLVVKESGSTVRKAKGEVWLSGKQMAYFAQLAQKDWSHSVEGLTKPGVSQNDVVYEPIGVCGQIIPWNFPFSMAVWKLGLALAAGNTVVLKPAEETPAVSLALAKLFQEAGLPNGVLNVVTGTGLEAGAPLAVHSGVDKIAFTGSTEVGKKIMASAASTMKRVTLECGGKSANIVLADADLEMAVDAALYAIFFHSGQCCTAGTRLFLQKEIHDAFMAKFLDKAKRIQLGDPTSPGTDMGPLISKKQQQRVLEYIAKGKAEGANCVLGGQTPEEADLKNGYFVSPTVFTNVKNTMTIAQEEIFGPVLSVIAFETPEEAVKLANDNPYGLAAAVWTENEEQARRLARQLRAGTVWINEYHLISEKAPFGGFKQSGLGRELGEEGIKSYLEVKHIHQDQLKSREKKFWYDSVLAPQTIS
jgi:acyl-CoA reductase-like NAD-dependent aldehyde dehydrogenase